MLNIEKTMEKVKALKVRSAWDKGVKLYAIELMENLEENREYHGDIINVQHLQKCLLNGARDWMQYSEGGCALIADDEIMERLSTKSELEKYRKGRKVDCMDMQARALRHAFFVIRTVAVFTNN